MLWPRKKSKIRLLLLSTRRQPNNVTTADLVDTAVMADTAATEAMDMATADAALPMTKLLKSSVMATTADTAAMAGTVTATVDVVPLRIRTLRSNATATTEAIAATEDTATATADVVRLKIRTLRSSVMATTEAIADMVAMGTEDIAGTTTVEHFLNM